MTPTPKRCECGMSICLDCYPKQAEMPPPRLQEIRKRAKAHDCDTTRDGEDVRDLLAILDTRQAVWDTHQTALRALVEQWRQSADLANPEARAAIRAVRVCADDVSRLLEQES